MSIQNQFINIYSTGRDCAIALSDFLVSFNYPEQHPTLTHFVHSLEGGWLYEINELKEISNIAKEAAKSVERCPWSVEQMISLFDKQLELVEAARKTVDNLKETRLYKLENGTVRIESSEISSKEKPWWASFEKRIAVIGLILAVLAFAVSVGIFKT
jgi:hypothetical protein